MRRPSHATIVAYLALFVALGGTSYAAITLKRGSVKGKHIAKNAVTSPKVKNGSLRLGDFAAGQLPRGEKGEPGPRGEAGETGPAGAPNPNAVNSDQLDGIDSSEFLRGRGRSFTNSTSLAPGTVAGSFIDLPTETFHFGLQYSCPAGNPSIAAGTLILTNRLNTPVNVFTDTGADNPGHIELAANATLNIPTTNPDDWIDLHVLPRQTFGAARVSIAVLHRTNNCLLHAQVLQSGESSDAH